MTYDLGNNRHAIPDVLFKFRDNNKDHSDETTNIGTTDDVDSEDDHEPSYDEAWSDDADTDSQWCGIKASGLKDCGCPYVEEILIKFYEIISLFLFSLLWFVQDTLELVSYISQSSLVKVDLRCNNRKIWFS